MDLKGIELGYLIAVLLTGFYAVTRFATPKAVRCQTTRFQYYGSCATYVISSVGLLILLTKVLEYKPEVLEILYYPEKAPENFKHLDVSLVAALILTTLLPSVPVLRDVDAAMLRFFHRMGAIPLGAVRWAQRMNMAQLKIPEKLLAETKQFIANSALLPDSLMKELEQESDLTPEGVRFRFTRCLALYVSLSGLRGWSGFAADFPEESAAFEKKMSSFFAQSVAFFALTAQLSQRQLEPVADSLEKFRSYALEAYEDIRLMLARVLLYSCNSDADVALQLEKVGFSIQRPSRIRVPANLLSLDVIGVVVLFVIATLFLSDRGPSGFSKALVVGALVGINNVIAATCALAPKQLWQFADFRSARERPFLSYLLSGACALTITLPLAYGSNLLLRAYFDQTFSFIVQAKWLLMPTVLAVALAFLCDDLIDADHEPWWLKLVESLGLAAIMALSGLLVIRWLQVDWAVLHPGAPARLPWVPVLLSAGIGGLFGVTIPYWYRKTMKGPVANDAETALMRTGPAAESVVNKPL